MSLIFDLADNQELLGYTRGVLQEEETNRFFLSQFLPNDNIDDIEWRATRGDLLYEDAATFRSWDAESPIGGRQGVSRIMGELAPISRKYRMGEEERLRLRALERGDNAGLVDAIFNDARKGARAVAARLEMMRGEVLATRALAISENGVEQPIDFGGDPDLDVAPGILWSDTANAVPVTDELEWLTAYRDVNGTSPALALTSTQVITNLSLNAQYRAFAAVNGITPAFLSVAQVNQVRAAYSLPPVAAYDTSVRVDGVQQRVIPTGRFIYVPPRSEPLGATFLGTTAEAIELVGARQIAADQAPGLVVVVEKTFDPVATWTKTAAVALSVLMNPDLILTAQVQADA